MGGLDLIIIAAVKTLIAPVMAFGADPISAFIITCSPIAMVLSTYLDAKIAKRGAKK
jgi:hypothetical protein